MKIKIESAMPTIRPGTPYGGWILPENYLNSHSVCYLVGAGEDVSFDLAVADTYGCPVHIFDPTPRAVKHVTLLRENLLTGKDTPCSTSPTGLYPAYPPDIAELLLLHPIGIWNEDTSLRFFAPSNTAHVSHSLVNLQQSEQSIEVPVRRLASIMAEMGHTRLNLLKIDIEGAEYKVIESIVADQIEIDILCIEFDESAAHHFDSKYMQRIKAALHALLGVGFHVIAKEAKCYNYTLLHERCMAS